MATVSDKRVEFLENYSTLALRFKPDKWAKFIGSEEINALLMEFFEKQDLLALVLTLNPAGQLTPCLEFPPALKSKAVYFVKKKRENITKENFQIGLLVGDISPSPVDQLMAVVEEENMSGWPKVVSDDVVKQGHRLKNEMFVMGGKIKGKTLLPLPEHLENLASSTDSLDRLPAAMDSSLLHAIETIIIDWSHQIRDVLSKDSAQPLLDGSNPLPKVEFEFWSSRLVNLQCIHEQLSPYIDSVMYTVCLIWANSEHYNTPSRIIVILQEICNLLIEMTRTFLSPEEVMKGLQGEIEEILGGIKLGPSIIERLYQTYHRCCSELMPTFFKELYVTAIEFLKLEKIELGGVRGNILGSMVFQIYEEVSELIKVFADCRYDPLDPAEKEFDEDFAEFQTKIQDLDRRLATIFSQGFNDCNSIESAVKQIHMFGSLLDRPLIKAEVSPHYSTLLEMFNVELDNAKIMYDAQIAATRSGGVPPISKNMPPVAGQLKWALELQERLETPMKELQAIDHPVMVSAEAKLVSEKYKEMIRLLQNYREKTYEEWISRVDADCQFNLEQPLIRRDPDATLISVNFSKELVAVLREVKYLNFQKQKDIPDSAGNLFSQNETFRKFVGNLDLIVGWYNKIKTTILSVELPLVKQELEENDIKLQKAETTLFWSNEGVMEYIQEMRNVLHDLEARIQKTKLNVENISQLMQENADLFKADKTSKTWQDYVEYVDDMVLDGFFQFIRKSLQFLLTNMAADSDLEDMSDLIEIREEVVSLVVSAMKQAEEYEDSFEKYSYLWMDDHHEFMQRFLMFGHVFTPEELESHAEDYLPRIPPTLEQFQQQIDSYEKLYEEVSKFENTKVFNGWLQSDCRPFKQALLNIIKRWSLMFKQHLIDHVTTSLQELAAFMKDANAGLTKPLKEGDYNGLVEVMGHLMRVKDRQTATDHMFEPLKQTIELLKTYGEEMPEEIHMQLHDLPEQWNNTKKLSFQVKQNVAPLQATEVAILRRKCQQFEIKQHEFREKFREDAPFSFTDPDPYRSLNTQQKSITAMESEMEALSKSAGLFEVSVPDYKQLKACHKEVRLLKELWDMIVLVNASIDDWKTTKWKEINVEQMDIDSKKFAKDVRSLDKEMRPWDAFIGLDNTVKNMITSLRAVSDLQNPAIRERHWHELMQATKVNFIMSDKTTLADLLQLNLHNFEDEVRSIVDKAVKESGMEKVLKALDSTWSTMQFEHEPHARTGTMLLKSDELLVETLEDNQVQLQNLMTSKYLAHFLQEVSGWQQKLSTADSVISIWFEVQRTWSHLESIFIGSEDIRNQLPEDSKRFDSIDRDFKELMAEAVKTPNVVEATNKPGLYEKLEVLQKSLALCEKALAEYLETKRLAFPRFYFVSSADLLDILSNGNDPVEVCRHLSKLFDSMAKLKFKMDSDNKPLKIGLGMYSKEDEYVDFDKECDCSGQVEVWLNRVLERMCSTLRHEIPEAVVTYEEKPREQWLFDYPAQIALTCTQIWWTTEVGIAFSRLEEGYENAIKDYNKKQINQLNTLITLLIGNLTSGDRMKIMTICTIDVHARDVVAKMILAKVENSQAFTWQSQLRHRWDEEKRHCYANICDAQLQYSYEYLGNTPRLVITPLTDRCYITLTQSLHLIMGGAPAGPAGTGKTETTKDLGRAVGIMVYVFNCSEQMDYKSCGNIYKGLAQTGAWGCFDEFNRISVEVLSVIAVQVGSFLQYPAILYVNYCDVVDHYDWGLRAIKSVLVVAGSLKRGDPGRPEDQVLMRALRDFNIPKIVTDDLPVFMGLIGDLFPALDVPRKRDLNFEKIIKQSILELKLQAEESFVLKVVQLEELLQVRHSVFVIGNAGSGKTQMSNADREQAKPWNYEQA
ncbi:dynein heavy chain 17, axonemal-like [Trachemys scripta elegans]|uniref:dynein heavy chain 17, axonemal-like n=1 Tax=Trachemys scripta elegans TaxID=31138 RepID=UPI001556671D|nr:dynein heavy chain 17, axonemal-like [Trachemys scripta elegans]